ncbi:MAG: hypothetical protein HDR26_01245 [Lachnospiraceae bacterium]|nr:hypothetical protein [Lachnospiraceae bacterium]
MGLTILEVRLNITRRSGKQECLELQKQEVPAGGKQEAAGGESWRAESETVRAEFYTERKEKLLTGGVRLNLKAEAFRENDGLCSRESVRIEVRFSDRPARMTAMYLHRDWWTRPAFIRSWEEMPERTQCIYLDYESAFGCIFLMAGEKFKTCARGGREGYLTLGMTAYRGGQMTLEEPVFVMALEGSALGAAEAACAGAAALAGCPKRSEKTYPEMFSWLGWCSWDAFYKEISEQRVCEKAQELREKDVPIRWLLMDDGWLSERENRLYDLKPEKDKFPDGFADMTARLKADGRILGVGVWHALGGYWGGIEPDSRAWQAQRDVLYKTVGGKILPCPDMGKGYVFYGRWYEQLRAQGIDFVKVDGQSAVKNYFDEDTAVCEAARELHRALEGAAGCYMGGNLINCMGMAMENILARPGSALSRGSDDFVPDNPKGFAEHLVQNIYNAPYHSFFYYCDWDMFWTDHADAGKHAALRAVSGGPVYCSDRCGETVPEVLRPLAYRDGRILRMERPALPAQDCLFEDPLAGGVVKVTNLGGCGMPDRKAGAVAVFNLSGQKQKFRVCSSDVYGLPAGSYRCYDWRSNTCHGDNAEFELEADGYGVYLLLPLCGDTAVVGLADKYMSMLALESVRQLGNGFLACVREPGSFVFCTDRKVRRLTVNGTDRLEEMQRQGDCCRINLEREDCGHSGAPQQTIVCAEYA